MPLPTLTTAQLLQNSVNAIVPFINQLASAQSQQGLVNTYNRIYNSIFSNPNGTAAQAVTQLDVNAVSVLADLAALRPCILAINSAATLGAIPAYTANNDGTVTLTVS